MSYEYTIKVLNNSAKDLTELIFNNAGKIKNLTIQKKGKKFFIKDIHLKNTWDYDLSFFEDNDSIFLTIVGWNEVLFNIFKISFEKFDFSITDDDTDEKIELENIFRIKK